MTSETTVAGVSAGRVRVVMIGMLMTVASAIGVSAWAQSAPPPAPPGIGPMGHGGPGMRGDVGEMLSGMHGGVRGGMGDGMMFGGSPEHMGRTVDFMLDGLGATDAQRSQIKQIAVQAAADMKAQAGAGKALRQRGMEIFTAPTVDAAAAEQLRQQMLARHDQASKRVMQAMLSIANVLTPAQRATLGQRLHDRQAQMEDRTKRMQDRMQDRQKGAAPEAPRR